ncbi:hypothetical protein [Vreelandella subterranea]|nr:hypothetical protein [Halomonas subterranea]
MIIIIRHIESAVDEWHSIQPDGVSGILLFEALGAHFIDCDN